MPANGRQDGQGEDSLTTNRAFKDWPKVFPDALIPSITNAFV